MGVIGRPRKPRCQFCDSNKPLEWGETVCAICKRECPGCGRRIPYSGRGQPKLTCPSCFETRRDRRLCPCGRPVPKGKLLYCSEACRVEAHRIRNGGRARLGWAPNLHTIAKREGDHEKAAGKLFAWLRRNAESLSVARSIELRGDSVFNVHGERLYVVRATGMGFNVSGEGLPKWVPVDDEDRLTTMVPEPGAYILLNGRLDVAFAVSPRYRERWKSESLFVPRYGGIATVLHCPREEGALKIIDARRG